MSSLIVATGFSTIHIAATAGITGVVALAASILVLGRSRSAVLESVVIGVLATVAVFLWRKSANMPQLNDDGLPPLSANDWLAPMLTYVVLGIYASVRRRSTDQRFAMAQAPRRVGGVRRQRRHDSDAFAVGAHRRLVRACGPCSCCADRARARRLSGIKAGNSRYSHHRRRHDH